MRTTALPKGCARAPACAVTGRKEAGRRPLGRIGGSRARCAARNDDGKSLAYVKGGNVRVGAGLVGVIGGSEGKNAILVVGDRIGERINDSAKP